MAVSTIHRRCAVDIKENQRIRATTTRTTARGSDMTTQTEMLSHALEALKAKMYAHAEMYLKEALAKPEQEPYGYLKLNTGKFFNEVEGLNQMTDKRYLPLYTKQEPAATSQATYNKICLGLAEAGCRLSEQQKMALASLVQDTTPPQSKEQEDLKLELALAGLVEKITGGMDSGNLLADAAIASKMLDAQPKEPEQEPVARWHFNSGFSHCQVHKLNEASKKNSAPLYLAPPQRTWVGLTDEESVELMRQFPHLTIGGLLAVEAKLREKNSL